MLVRVRRALARTSLARIVALPMRTVVVARHVSRQAWLATKWLASSREYTNFTYHISARNRRQLARLVETATGCPVEEIERYFQELEDDAELRSVLQERARTGARRGLADANPRYGRRAVWYAIVRILKPRVVVETGVDKGLGSMVVAAALARNQDESSPGRLLALDINPDAGSLIGGRYQAHVDLVITESIRWLESNREPVGLFVHDSNHSYAHETRELEAVSRSLDPDALLISDAACESDALDDFARREGWRFVYCSETPEGHWFPGQGVGIAFRIRDART